MRVCVLRKLGKQIEDLRRLRSANLNALKSLGDELKNSLPLELASAPFRFRKGLQKTIRKFFWKKLKYL